MRHRYGIDGNWSSMGIFVGEAAQTVDVIVSTSLAEVWVVETGGCGSSKETMTRGTLVVSNTSDSGDLCTAARGDVFNISASSSWSSMGAWELGLDYLGKEANGDYAMETVVVYDSVTRNTLSLSKLVVAAINDTDYYTGFFGLGITPGRFGTSIVQSPITTMVEQAGVAPSHSYGYTAGAYYGMFFLRVNMTIATSIAATDVFSSWFLWRIHVADRRGLRRESIRCSWDELQLELHHPAT